MSKLDAPPKDEATEKADEVLKQLIAEQGITPINNLDELAALWPADDDPDALMNLVLAERQARLDAEDQQSR